MRYTSDLTDAQWEQIKDYFPAGNKSKYEKRELVNAVLYLVKTGCQWRNFSDEFNALCIPFEESLTETQLTTFHKLLDCVSDTAAAEMITAYKAGFKDSVAMMRETQE